MPDDEDADPAAARALLDAAGYARPLAARGDHGAGRRTGWSRRSRSGARSWACRSGSRRWSSATTSRPSTSERCRSSPSAGSPTIRHPYALYSLLLLPDAASNYGGWRDDEFVRLLEAASAAATEAQADSGLRRAWTHTWTSRHRSFRGRTAPAGGWRAPACAGLGNLTTGLLDFGTGLVGRLRRRAASRGAGAGDGRWPARRRARRPPSPVSASPAADATVRRPDDLPRGAARWRAGSPGPAAHLRRQRRDVRRAGRRERGRRAVRLGHLDPASHPEHADQLPLAGHQRAAPSASRRRTSCSTTTIARASTGRAHRSVTRPCTGTAARSRRHAASASSRPAERSARSSCSGTSSTGRSTSSSTTRGTTSSARWGRARASGPARRPTRSCAPSSCGSAAAPTRTSSTTIVHEVTHVVFHDATANPFHEPAKWFNEGLSTWSEQQSADLGAVHRRLRGEWRRPLRLPRHRRAVPDRDARIAASRTRWGRPWWT